MASATVLLLTLFPTVQRKVSRHNLVAAEVQQPEDAKPIGGYDVDDVVGRVLAYYLRVVEHHRRIEGECTAVNVEENGAQLVLSINGGASSTISGDFFYLFASFSSKDVDVQAVLERKKVDTVKKYKNGRSWRERRSQSTTNVGRL